LKVVCSCGCVTIANPCRHEPKCILSSEWIFSLNIGHPSPFSLWTFFIDTLVLRSLAAGHPFPNTRCKTQCICHPESLLPYPRSLPRPHTAFPQHGW
jgi:hypothetical protein